MPTAIAPLHQFMAEVADLSAWRAQVRRKTAERVQRWRVKRNATPPGPPEELAPPVTLPLACPWEDLRALRSCLVERMRALGTPTKQVLFGLGWTAEGEGKFAQWCDPLTSQHYTYEVALLIEKDRAALVVTEHLPEVQIASAHLPQERGRGRQLLDREGMTEQQAARMDRRNEREGRRYQARKGEIQP